MIGIVPHNAGNLGSVARTLERLGIASRFLENADELEAVDGLILPGAGAARAAMDSLASHGFVAGLRTYQKPFLGICLGMQLLFEFSEEGDTECLGVVPGAVRSLPDTAIKPHMGWNQLNSGDFAYFVHGYVCQPKDNKVVTMTTWYGSEICVGVRWRNYLGVQWHPEKSGRVGDEFLLSFARLCN